LLHQPPSEHVRARDVAERVQQGEREQQEHPQRDRDHHDEQQHRGDRQEEEDRRAEPERGARPPAERVGERTVDAGEEQQQYEPQDEGGDRVAEPPHVARDPAEPLEVEPARDPLDLAPHRGSILDLCILSAGDVAAHLGAGTDDHAAVERHDVVTHGPGDLDVAVERHHALGGRAFDHRVAVEDHRGSDRGSHGNEQLAREHDLIVVAGCRALVLRERRGRGRDPEDARDDRHGEERPVCRSCSSLAHPLDLRPRRHGCRPRWAKWYRGLEGNDRGFPATSSSLTRLLRPAP
jgi:hypothetical protein